MNFKELAQETARLCEMNGAISDVTTAVGVLADAVRWTSRAWVRIQHTHRDWEFLRGKFQFDTVASQSEYTPLQMGATDLASIDFGTVSAYDAGIGRSDEQWLDDWSYDNLIDSFDFQSTQIGRPLAWALRMDTRALALGPTPDRVYTVRGWYRRMAQVLAANADTPLIDADLHMVIPYYAAITYANLEVAGERKTEMVEALRDHWSTLERRYLKSFEFEGPAL